MIKKVLAGFMAIGLVLSNWSSLESCAESKEFSVGDVTMNGSVDSADLLKLKRILLGLGVSSENMEALGDVNQDSKTNSLDCLLLKRVLLGVDEAPDLVLSLEPIVTSGSIELKNSFVANWIKYWDDGITEVEVASDENEEFTIEELFRPLGEQQEFVFNSLCDGDTMALRGEEFEVSGMKLNVQSKSMSVPTNKGSIEVTTEGDNSVFKCLNSSGEESFVAESGLDNEFLLDTECVSVSVNDCECSLTGQELQGPQGFISFTGSGFVSDNFTVTLGEDESGNHVIVVSDSETGEVLNSFSVSEESKTIKSSDFKIYCSFSESLSRVGLEDFTSDKYYGVTLGDGELSDLVVMEHLETGESIVSKYESSYGSGEYKALSVSCLNTEKLFNNLWSFEFEEAGDCSQLVIWESEELFSVCTNEVVGEGYSVVLEKVVSDGSCQNEFTAYGVSDNEKIVVSEDSIGGQDKSGHICYGRVDEGVYSYYGEVDSYGVSLVSNPVEGSIRSLVLLGGDENSQVLDCNFNWDSF